MRNRRPFLFSLVLIAASACTRSGPNAEAPGSPPWRLDECLNYCEVAGSICAGEPLPDFQAECAAYCRDPEESSGSKTPEATVQVFGGPGRMNAQIRCARGVTTPDDCLDFQDCVMGLDRTPDSMMPMPIAPLPHQHPVPAPRPRPRPR